MASLLQIWAGIVATWSLATRATLQISSGAVYICVCCANCVGTEHKVHDRVGRKLHAVHSACLVSDSFRQLVMHQHMQSSA